MDVGLPLVTQRRKQGGDERDRVREQLQRRERVRPSTALAQQTGRSRGGSTRSLSLTNFCLWCVVLGAVAAGARSSLAAAPEMPVIELFKPDMYR